jgi:hypothetical protein
MANDASRVGILHELLVESGVPVDGISVADINANPVAYAVQYSASATVEQIALGDQLGAAFDWRKRRSLPRATIVTALNQLTNAQINAILRHQAAEYLRNNPQLALKLFAALDIPVVVDEVDPT